MQGLSDLNGGWRYAPHPAICTLHPKSHTLHYTHYTLHPTPSTLRPTPSTPHPTPYTLHPTPCTLHPRRGEAHSDDGPALGRAVSSGGGDAGAQGGSAQGGGTQGGSAQGGGVPGGSAPERRVSVLEGAMAVLGTKVTFIVSHGIIHGKGLQFPGTNFVDKTLKPPESTYKTTFLVLFRIWYTICTRAWSPLPVIIPWKTMNLITPCL